MLLFKNLQVLTFILLFLSTAKGLAQQFVVVRLDLISSQRITRTEFEYVYRVQVANAGAAVAQVTATVTSGSSATKVVDNSLSFGAIPAGTTAFSMDTFAIWHDRIQPFNPTALSFRFDIGNRSPLAAAGPDQTLQLGAVVQLNGSGSSDLDGDSLSFAWSFVSRPAGSGATLSNSTAVSPTFMADQVGTYVVRLVVNDGRVDSSPDTVAIAVAGNSPPVAEAGPNQTVPVGQTVQLSGSGSSDANGDLLTFAWSFISRPAGSGATLSNSMGVDPTFVADRPGTYVIQLIVNDSKVNSTPDTVTVTTVNSPPVAEAGPNQTVQVGATVQLIGSGSSDPDGDALTFTWSFVSRPTGSTATLNGPTAVNPMFTADRPGTYVVQLVVNDGKVSSLPDTITITTGTSPPVAEAGANQRVAQGATVQLNGSSSSDPDGDLLTFSWSFVTRPAGSAATLSNPAAVNPTFVADQPGTYVVQLLVNDGKVNSNPDTAIITTTGNSPPVAESGPNQTVPIGSTVQLNGSSSSDPDGDAVTFIWSLASRPTGSMATLSNPGSINPTFVADRIGTYVVQLVVNDGKVNSGPDSVTITTDNSPPVANAGPDRSIAVGAVVQLDGGGSSDPNNDPLTFRWALISRPQNSNAALSNPAAVNPTFVADQLGVYVVQLVVNDGRVDSPPDTVMITTTSTVLECGSLLTGSISAAAEVNQITFSGQTNQRVTLTLTAAFPTFVTASAIVFSPTLVQVASFNANSQQQLTLPETGTYIIQIRASNLASSGTYSIGMECLQPARPVDATLACGTLLSSGAIEASAEVDQITFSGQANQRVTLTFTAGFPTFVTASAIVFSPTLVQVASFNANSQQQLTLPETGTYVIQIRASNLVSAGTYSIGMECLQPASPVDATLACGTLLSSGAIEASAEVDQITFSGQANQRVTLTFTAGFPTFVTASAIVFSPTLVQVASFNANSQQQLTLPETGTYIIQIRASNLASSGTYSIGMECLQPASPVDATLACGTLLSSGAIEASAEVDQITFSGQANQRVTLTFTAGFPTFVTASAIVFSPTLVQVASFNANSQQQLTLPEAGTYIIQIRASNLVSAGTYSTGMQCLPGS